MNEWLIGIKNRLRNIMLCYIKMVRESTLRAIKKYRDKNPEKYKEYSRKSRMVHYYKNRNYTKVDDMYKSFHRLFRNI